MTTTPRRFLPKLLIFAAAFSLGAIFAVCGQQPASFLGILSYFEGDIEIYRDGELVPWQDVTFGFEIEEYDLLLCLESGTATVEYLLPSRANVVVHVQPNTAFYVRLGAVSSGIQSRFELLKGEIGFRVADLLFPGEVSIITQKVAMGVRGTEFTVITAPDGSLLITCSEGEVLCIDDAGNDRSAAAGLAVEKTETAFRNIEVDTDALDSFESEWFEERERIFLTAASVFIREFAARYLTLRDLFDDAVRELARQEKVFNDLYAIRLSGDQPAVSDVLAARGAVGPAIVKARSVFPMFERVFYQLTVLADYHDSGHGTTSIRPGLSSAAFFRRFNRERADIESELAKVRFYLKLYGWTGRLSGVELLDEVFSVDN